ncbi:retrovirus-related Pol polyprotein from transposon 17.6 [Trichonephila clavipes]|nr:retrovirus-related Pol polyprotein from transposon 17.6 [Trichonephila clavipes]
MLKPYHRRPELLNVVLVDTEEITESSELEEDFSYMLIDPNVFDFREIVENNKLNERLSDEQIMQLGKLLEEHLKHLQDILERLKKANLTIKPSKCKFAQREVQYLGHVVGRVEPLTDLLKGVNKRGGIVWNDKCSESFKMLKEKLHGKPVLHAPDFSKPFIVQADASDEGYVSPKG